MITKLDPQRAVEIFDQVYGVLRLPLAKIENEDRRKELMMRDLLAGNLQFWVASKEDKTVVAVAATRLMVDDYDGDRLLRIVSVWGFEKIPMEIWEEGFKEIGEFARRQKCKKVVAETDNRRVEELADNFGFNKTTLIEVEVR